MVRGPEEKSIRQRYTTGGFDTASRNQRVLGKINPMGEKAANRDQREKIYKKKRDESRDKIVGGGGRWYESEEGVRNIFSGGRGKKEVLEGTGHQIEELATFR